MKQIEKVIEFQNKQIADLTKMLARVLSYQRLANDRQPELKYDGANQAFIDNQISNYLNDGKTAPLKKEEIIMPYLREGTIRYRPDGRWETRGMLENKKQGSTACGKNQQEVIKKHYERLKLRDKNLRDENYAMKNLKLFDFLDLWFETEVKARIRTGDKKEKGKVSKSYANKTKWAIGNVKKNFPNKLLNEFTVFELESASRQIEMGRTRESVDALIGQSLTYAHKKGFIRTNIVQHFDKYKSVRKQTPVFTVAEQNAFLDYSKKHSRYHDYFMFYFHTGCRPAEIRRIRKRDFDFTAGNKSVFIDGTKTVLSSRRIPLFASLWYLEKMIKDLNDDDFVFTAMEKTLRLAFHKIIEAIGLAGKGFVLYSARHSCNTRWYENGVDEKARKAWMGHSENSTINDKVYTHLTSEHERSQIELVDKMFAPKSAPKNYEKIKKTMENECEVHYMLG